MSTTTVDDDGVDTPKGSAAEQAIASAQQHDDRLAYRGVFQRLLVRPEIGAMIGAIGIWTFFWAVSVVFGTAAGAQNILDFAATLGIMAVAVSMLMIGGEFDLSSGANTGAMGMLCIYLVKNRGELGGAGLPIWAGLLISLAVALAIGWLNGFMVERTQLPSFIVTLATFFVLMGLKLGLSKRFVQKIEMGRMDEGAGFGFWDKIFAGEWLRNDHVWSDRDIVYTILCLVGLGLIAVAVYQIHFARRERPKSAGIPVFLVGVGAVVAGILVLHRTDSIPMNWVGAIVIAVGTLVAAVGLGTWQYQPYAERGRIRLSGEILQPLGIGLALMVVGFLSAILIDSNDKNSFIFPFTVQGFRALLMGVFIGVGFVYMFMASVRANRVNSITKAVISAIIVAVEIAFAFMIQYESKSYKFRVEAFSVVLVAALMLAVWTFVGLLFETRRTDNHAVDRSAGWIAAGGIVLFTIGIVIKCLFNTPAEIAADATQVKFSMRIVWFVGFTAVMVWVLGKSRFGSWTFAVGGNAKAARETGVPAARTKTQLFMLVSAAAWLVGVLIGFRINSLQANTGNQQEFVYIIAAVVGGTLLTGGYGTALGGAIGALVMSMATIGIPASGWESDWQFLFLGVILLVAVIANNFIRTKAEALR